ncbi:hypothetical protein [Pseudomonas sp. YL2]|uniref:hypothetical protein n=1 Tax=Pseudomonas sp. YL2 TaxID=2904251 RepID=UPI001FF139B5|nr:hypothetical protein [Pseudomonas sp. YL2]
MMRRGSRFWLWADCELHCRSHDEVLIDGTIIDVQTRVSRKGRTQLFLGVYSKDGLPLYEEAHDDLPNDTMTTALAWGVGRARAKAADSLSHTNSASESSQAISSNKRTSSA